MSDTQTITPEQIASAGADIYQKFLQAGFTKEDATQHAITAMLDRVHALIDEVIRPGLEKMLQEKISQQ